MKCPACHEEYDDQMEYCPFCGNDNPKVDPKGKDISQVAETNETNYSQNNSQKETMEIYSRNGKMYNLEFDLNDEYEKSAYEELKQIENKKTSSYFGIVVAILLIFVPIVLLRVNQNLGLIVWIFAIIAGIPLSFGSVFRYNELARELAEKQLNYAQYTLKKTGCNIKSIDKETLTIVFEKNNKTYCLALKYRKAGRRYNHWSD